MKRSGSADLPLHHGRVPSWLYERMSRLGLAITEAILTEHGREEWLRRMSDPFWFQSFGAVMGMDWHSSGITTSVLGALKRAINPLGKELGIYICGGKGRQSTGAPDELVRVGEQTGLDAGRLIRSSKLSAKVDNAAVQDGFQLYLHNFIVSAEGHWTVVQQGMREKDGLARRYHWHSEGLRSFVETPHSGVCGENQGLILNLTDASAQTARKGMLELTREQPEKLLPQIQELILPRHHDVRSEDVDLRRLGAALWLAHERTPAGFEDLLLLEGIGPRTVQSLALVSEVVHGTPSRFRDPARFSFAHGGKDGHPFPVPTRTMDEVIDTLQKAVRGAKIGQTEKAEALRKIHMMAVQAEKDFTPTDNLQAQIEKEIGESWQYGGRTIFGKATPPKRSRGVQLRMF
ncbi:MAG TPA: DUF763 domain-containing protein [Chitinophagaceae bacterium]|jgi:hypothetical protein|nr:DUF763 domain-containing protein [Chitinophagaceae bacterium]